MPYKDPDKRAAYMREYKGRGKPETPCKCYVCPSILTLIFTGMTYISGTAFSLPITRHCRNKIESHEYYGEYIFSWRVEPCPG